MGNIVKLQEIVPNSNYKKFDSCIVLPIVNSAGSRSRHIGNLVFWNFHTIQERKLEWFIADEKAKINEFIKSLGERFIGTEEVPGATGKYEILGNRIKDVIEIYFWKPKYVIPEGNYSVSPKEKDGKINFHFNKVENEPNALWVDYSSFENFHTEDLWTIIESVEGNYILQDTIHSGGDGHHSNLFIGILKNGTILRHYIESYKGRQGYSIITYKY
jgi:hypothetical protein